MPRQSFKASSGDENSKIQLPPSADEFPDTVSVDLDGSDPNAFEIIEEDDTPEEDRGRPTEYEPDPNFDDEVENLRSRGKKSVESRIKRLSFERETERRAKEAALREREAAIEMARAAQAEAEALRQRVEQSGAVLADSMLSRNETALREAKQLLKMAYAAGDTDAIAEAQTAISRLAAEELAIRQRMPTQAEQEARQQQVQQPVYAPPQPAAPQLAPNVAAWISRNSWFGKPGNEDRTEFAMSIHRTLVARGVNPASPEYTKELDRGLKAMYKDHQASNDYVDDMSEDDGSDEPRRVARRPNATADASRENGVSQTPNKRAVTLTRSELSIAKRLGVSPQAYAAQKLRRQQADGDGA